MGACAGAPFRAGGGSVNVRRMDIHEALRRRASVRAFRPDPVDDALLARVLARALDAPSWANTQPYRLAVANGAAATALRSALQAALASRVPGGDHNLLFDYPAELQARRRTTGFGLYAALGIGRDDREARGEQYARNFAFFDAPAAAFLFAHEALGVYSVLDAGVFLQSLMLAAVADGLGTCAQAALASYPDVVRRHFDVPDGYKLLCGVSIGYPAEAAVNRFRPARMGVGELLIPARRDATDAAHPHDPVTSYATFTEA
jgi:nitroreductase